MEKITENKELMGKANKFRHALYEIKAADERVCKLVNVKEHNKPVLVDPLSADTVFDTWTVAREKGILDTAYEMVLDPTNRTKRDSDEYKKVMASILKAKDILSQNYPIRNQPSAVFSMSTPALSTTVTASESPA